MTFSEPLSFLQRITEDLEYADCLDAAAALTDDDSCLRLAYVSAFAMSSYANTIHRIARPFNPLLAETFECNRTSDLGWKSIAEKVLLWLRKNLGGLEQLTVYLIPFKQLHDKIQTQIRT